MSIFNFFFRILPNFSQRKSGLINLENQNMLLFREKMFVQQSPENLKNSNKAYRRGCRKPVRVGAILD